MSGCIGEPVSWLALERYALGELDPARSEAVRTHVATCPACAQCLDSVRVATPLPALPVPARPEPSRWAWLSPLRLGAALAGAAALAVLVVAVRPHERAEGPAGVKGGDELALVLLRERGGVVQESPTTFAPGDRFKVRVSCAPGAMSWDLVVRQRGAESHPLHSDGPLSCANNTVLPGAFTLDGTAPVRVCAIVGGHTACRDLLPAP